MFQYYTVLLSLQLDAFKAALVAVRYLVSAVGIVDFDPDINVPTDEMIGFNSSIRILRLVWQIIGIHTL